MEGEECSAALTMSACDSFLHARVAHTVRFCPEETTLSQAMAFTLQVRAGLPNSHSTQQWTEMAMALESSEADDLHRETSSRGAKSVKRGWMGQLWC